MSSPPTLGRSAQQAQAHGCADSEKRSRGNPHLSASTGTDAVRVAPRQASFPDASRTVGGGRSTAS